MTITGAVMKDTFPPHCMENRIAETKQKIMERMIMAKPVLPAECSASGSNVPMAAAMIRKSALSYAKALSVLPG